MELTFCPKCGKDLMPGKHHVGCSAGKSAPRQAAKRQRQVTVSTTTTMESEWASETEPTTQAGASLSFEEASGWPLNTRQRSVRARRQASVIDESELISKPRETDKSPTDVDRKSTKGRKEQNAAASASGKRRATPGLPGSSTTCRFGLMHQTMNTGDHHTAELVFTANAYADFGLLLHNGVDKMKSDENSKLYSPSNNVYENNLEKAEEIDPIARTDSSGRNFPAQQHSINEDAGISDQPLTSLLDADSDGLAMNIDGVEDLSSMLRVPSPPPLPPGWETGPPMGMLFDFDQFDVTRRSTLNPGDACPDGARSSAPPEHTITSTMQPSEVSNPSDDYIWQIMFASENESVPKRVTAHLHHPLQDSSSPRSIGSDGDKNIESNLKTLFQDTDPFMDSVVAEMEHKEHGMMLPPPPRQPSGDLFSNSHNDMRERKHSSQLHIPPIPQEAIQVANNKHEGNGPTSLTVTYDVTYNNGVPQYAVRHVETKDTTNAQLNGKSHR